MGNNNLDNVSEETTNSTVSEGKNSSEASPSGQTSMEPNVLAALSHLVSPISGFVVLSMEKENEFVRFHAMQSAIMGVAGLLGMLASGVLSVVIIGAILGPVIFLLYMYYWVVLIIKSYNNEEYEIPYIGKMARERLQKM